jgi:hypothetical protein
MIVPVVIILVTIAVLVDVITKDDSQVRYLPKLVWVFIVLFFPIVGSLVWLLAGRDWAPVSSYASPDSAPAASPFRSTEDELAALDAEIAFHEKQARLARLEAEVAEKRKRKQG